MINKDILLAYGAVYKQYKQGEILFEEGDMPQFYFQVVKGCVKMENIYEDGKEFIQGHFYEGDSFAEPVLFINEPYPTTGIANSDCTILRLYKDNFQKMLLDFPEFLHDLIVLFSKRLYGKSIIAKEIAGCPPEHRILTILSQYKKIHHLPKSELAKIPLTRQEIANMSGLRVETVIRTMKAMEKNGIIQIEAGKVYY